MYVNFMMRAINLPIENVSPHSTMRKEEEPNRHQFSEIGKYISHF